MKPAKEDRRDDPGHEPARHCPENDPMTSATPIDARESTPVPPRHDARDLTCGGSLATITLDGAAYVLRITRAGKLILTK